MHKQGNSHTTPGCLEQMVVWYHAQCCFVEVALSLQLGTSFFHKEVHKLPFIMQSPAAESNARHPHGEANTPPITCTKATRVQRCVGFSFCCTAHRIKGVCPLRMRMLQSAPPRIRTLACSNCSVVRARSILRFISRWRKSRNASLFGPAHNARNTHANVIHTHDATHACPVPATPPQQRTLASLQS